MWALSSVGRAITMNQPYVTVTQLVECSTFNRNVVSSNLISHTSKTARMAMGADRRVIS